MKMARFVILKTRELPDDLSVLDETVDDIKVTYDCKTKEGEYSYILVHSTIALDGIPVKDNEWIIPESKRQKCEEAIEAVVASLAAFHLIKIELMSPSNLCVAFEPETDEEWTAVKNVKAFKNLQKHMEISFSPPSRNTPWTSCLDDRKDGLLLLKDAIDQTSTSGAFRDYLRVFENAFQLPSHQLRKKLNKFLMPRMNYSIDEINRWIEMRDPLSHADGLKAKATLFQSDAAPYISRIQQAAYDVLYNKSEWRNKSIKRRDVWSPQVFTNGPNNEPVITAGSKGVKLRMSDIFGVYPEFGKIDKLNPSYIPYIDQDGKVVHSRQ